MNIFYVDKDPKVAAVETRKKQSEFLSSLDKDMETKVALDKAKKDDDMFQYRDRKPVARKTYDGIDIDLDTVRSTAIHRQLEQDLFIARQLQLDGVPYFIFNEQYAVAGAHLSEHFLPVIDAATA